MTEPGQLTFDDGLLLCPLCGDDYVHLNDVFVAGRPEGEDGPIKNVTVSNAGRVTEGDLVEFPSQQVGRRHSLALAGDCEHCGEGFAIEFRQHKGQTRVQVIRR